MSKSIPIIPNWRTAMQILIAVLEDGTEEGKAQAKAELLAMAERVDHLAELYERGNLKAKLQRFGGERDG